MSLAVARAPDFSQNAENRAGKITAERLALLLPDITRELAKTAAHYDRTGEFPHANLALLHAHGLLSLAVPYAFGGPEFSLAELRHVISAVAKGEPSTALLLVMQYIHHQVLLDKVEWPQSLRATVYQNALEDGALINSFRVEVAVGSPLRGGLPATTARRTPQGWRLSGEKICATGIEGLTWLLIWAKSDDPTPLVGAWLVRRAAPGIRITENWDYLGMRATGSHTIVLENVLTPLEYAVNVTPSNQPANPQSAAWQGFPRANATLIGALYDGIAQAARDAFIDWLKNTVPSNLGAPLASLPTLQQKAAEIDSLLLQNRCLLDALASAPLRENEPGLLQATVLENAIAAVEKIL
ncbi:MAG: acyl-CoA/acyl-ACP dehydrogenase, partial [Zoogloeaceae bacterium]|nr:acyl-CoA/acyl-ACP dehydrogenase [Zoogloeaceae bacterium]